MKVSKLMELLAKCDQEAPVVLADAISEDDGGAANFIVYHPATGNVVISDSA